MDIFYLFSKFINFFLQPGHWIILLLIYSFISKRQRLKKILRISAVIVFILFSNKALFNVASNAWQTKRVSLKDSVGYSAGIILGGMSQTDRHGRGYFTEAGDRFIQTVQLYHRGVIKKIIITGATFGNDLYAEGDYLVPEFIKAGVLPSDIIAESKANNTFQNAAYTRVLLDSLNLRPPYIVITSAFHIRRSKKVFDKAGLEVIMYPSHYLSVRKKPSVADLFLPQIKTLDDWKYLVKEWIGIAGYTLTKKA